MSNLVLTGSDEFMDKVPMKTFNEAFEIKVRKMLSPHIEGENRVDGEIAWVIKDYDKLLIDLMEFIQNEKSPNK